MTRVLGAAAASDERVVRFTFIPFVSIYVNADQLSRLLADPQAVTHHRGRAEKPLAHHQRAADQGSAGLGQGVYRQSLFDRRHRQRRRQDAFFPLRFGRVGSLLFDGEPAQPAIAVSRRAPRRRRRTIPGSIAAPRCRAATTEPTSPRSRPATPLAGAFAEVAHDASIIAIQSFHRETRPDCRARPIRLRASGRLIPPSSKAWNAPTPCAPRAKWRPSI